MKADDGSKLCIDRQIVVDNDGPWGTRECEYCDNGLSYQLGDGTVHLAAGMHDITIVYHEGEGDELFEVKWTPTPGATLVVMTSDMLSNSVGCLMFVQDVILSCTSPRHCSGAGSTDSIGAAAAGSACAAAASSPDSSCSSLSVSLCLSLSVSLSPAAAAPSPDSGCSPRESTLCSGGDCVPSACGTTTCHVHRQSERDKNRRV